MGRRLIAAVAVALGTTLGATAAALAATPAKDGTITGQLGIEGGAYPGTLRPTAGILTVTGSVTVTEVNVPKSGDFTIHVHPGHYTLTGCGGTNNKQCGPSQHVTIKRGATKQVQVPWILAP